MKKQVDKLIETENEVNVNLNSWLRQTGDILDGQHRVDAIRRYFDGNEKSGPTFGSYGFGKPRWKSLAS